MPTLHSSLCTLHLLVCTLDERIAAVPQMLLPPQEGVRWVVSMQYTDERFLQQIPSVLRERSDVHLLTLPGKGLSRNRNHALAFVRQALFSEADSEHCTLSEPCRLAGRLQGSHLQAMGIGRMDSSLFTLHSSLPHACLISDDDVRYALPQLQALRRCLADNPQVDVALFEMTAPDGTPLKPYPTRSMTYREAMAVRGYYPTSMEIVLGARAVEQLHFDERFGLGSPALPCGEEEVLLCDALREGLDVRFFPLVIGQTDPATTGLRFLSDPAVQRAKGAVFAYTLPRTRAYYKMGKEALHHFLYGRANPFPLLRHMQEGASLLAQR